MTVFDIFHPLYKNWLPVLSIADASLERIKLCQAVNYINFRCAIVKTELNRKDIFSEFIQYIRVITLTDWISSSFAGV